MVWHRLLPPSLYRSTSRKVNCYFSSTSKLELIFRCLLQRGFRNLLSSLFPCLQIWNVSSAYLEQMVSFQHSNSSFQLWYLPSNNRLTTKSDRGSFSVRLYRCALYNKYMLLTQCLLRSIMYSKGWYLFLMIFNIFSIGENITRNITANNMTIYKPTYPKPTEWYGRKCL